MVKEETVRYSYVRSECKRTYGAAWVDGDTTSAGDTGEEKGEDEGIKPIVFTGWTERSIPFEQHLFGDR